MSVILSEGCSGNCNQGRAPCDCPLSSDHNLETLRDLDTLYARNEYDDALNLLGHRIVEWACAVGIITLVYLIAFRGF